MTTNRSAALAIITGSLAGLVTMALHPTADAASHGGATTLALAVGVHWLGIVAQPLVLAGTLALTLHLRVRRDLAVGAFIFFALASVAVIIAAVASGMLATGLLRDLETADAPARVLLLNALRYTGQLNRAFAAVYVVFSGVAILLWSAAMLAGRELSRALALYGIVLGAALILGIAAGHLRLDVHGFGAVVLGVGVWMIWAAVVLWRASER